MLHPVAYPNSPLIIFEFVAPYPESVTMKYPKPGFNNPLVSVHIFDLQAHLAESEGAEEGSAIPEAVLELSWEAQRRLTDSIIQEVAWVGKNSLIIKEVSRAADEGSVILFDLSSQDGHKGRVVRKLGKKGEEGDDGWIEAVSLHQA